MSLQVDPPYAIDHLVSKFFSLAASAPKKEFNEAMANVLILLAGSFAVGVKPGKKLIKVLLGGSPVFGHSAHLTRKPGIMAAPQAHSACGQSVFSSICTRKRKSAG
jgi:hypothetical protein